MQMSQKAEKLENTGKVADASGIAKEANTADRANDDRIPDVYADVRLPKPQVVIIRDGESVYKPGMKTYLAGVPEGETEDREGSDKGIKGSEGRTVGGVICTCNSVCTCNTQSTCSCNTHTHSTCTCNTQRSCSCNNNRGGGYRVCSCNPVH